LLRVRNDSQKLNVTEVDYQKPDNVFRGSDIIVGDAAADMIVKGVIRKERVNEFYNNVLEFYKFSCNYIKMKVPLMCETLRNCQVADFNMQVSAPWSSLQTLETKFPAVDVQIADIQKQFKLYQIIDISVVREKLRLGGLTVAGKK